MSQRSIEVKVGALILVALGLLGAFVVVMGGLSFEPTFTVYVAFHNPGGLQAGAPVRISGVKVGRVASMEFRGGLVDPKTHEREPLIRAVAKLEKRYQEAVRQDSRWFVTSQGVLGEMFLAVEPGTLEKPMLADGAVVQGISPPRLNLLLSESYELLHRAYLGITNNEQKLQETFDGLHRTLKASGDFCVGVGAFPDGHPERFDLDLDARVLAEKEQAGADFAVTQLFFDADAYFRLVDRVRALGCTLPIVAGIMPVTVVSQIERFASLSGADLPAPIVAFAPTVTGATSAVSEPMKAPSSMTVRYLFAPS